MLRDATRGRDVLGRGVVGLVLGAGVLAMGGAGRDEYVRPISVESVELVATHETPSKRERGARVDDAALAGLKVGDRVAFDLFERLALRGTVVEAKDDHGFRVIDGRLEREPYGTFQIVAGRGTATMEVRSTVHGSYEVRRTADGGYVVREIDDHGWKPCACGPEHHVDAGGMDGREIGEAGYGPRGTPLIRVMVVYTAEARDAEGGDAAIQSRAVFAINQANAAYVASQANAQVELAYVGLVGYVESGNASTDLSRLRGTSDGFMDNVHCIRDAVGADMVALLVRQFNACGIAYLMTNPGPGFASSAFSVTDKDCISGFTFAHELGHNMGCAHDRANAGNAAYPYAYGYRTPNNQYRTILAYSPGTRVGRFSNPNVTFNGFVMGVPIGEPDAAYNAQGITNTAPIIENFRSGGVLNPDFNGDGNVDQDDIACLVQTVAGNPSCGGGSDPDYTRDGNVDQDDIAALMQIVGGGFCP